MPTGGNAAPISSDDATERGAACTEAGARRGARGRHLEQALTHQQGRGPSPSRDCNGWTSAYRVWYDRHRPRSHAGSSDNRNENDG